MPEFLSKLQHKTYEKGEFSDEQVRSLDETIELIKSFPWDTERTLTDVQLTGPSVTIHDEDINYLKVGLYFNGKYCLYYLDRNNHLYEYHAPDITDACKIVTDFFAGQLDLENFEKHFFNIGNQAHFVTNYFEYREKVWRILLLNILTLIYGIFFICISTGLIKSNQPTGLSFMIILFAGLFLFLLGRIFYSAIINRNNYLQISRGNDLFKFGYNEKNIQTYSKKDIDKVVIYESRGNRNPNLVCMYEIYFKDGNVIKFSNMLISDMALKSKFPDFTITYGRKSILKML
jgi:hypothetical protein